MRHTIWSVKNIDFNSDKMTDKLTELEKQIGHLSEKSGLSGENLLVFPENFRQVHSFKIFGDNLLAIPANLIIEGDDEEFEKPFSFLDSLENLKLFESEFRPEVPYDFIQIGNLYGSAEIVLLNKLKDTIHIFHVSDLSDKDWLKYKLEKGICDLESFIDSLRVQTICCLMDPTDYSKWDICEIRNNEILTGAGLLKFTDKETACMEYKRFIEKSLESGFQIHYAPKKILNELQQ